MNRSFHLAALWTCVSLTSGAIAAEMDPAPALEQATALLQEIESRFTGLASLRYQVACTSQNNQQMQTERWAFAYRSPDCIRIDYHAPQARTLVVNAEEMWEYIPQANKAVRTDLTRLATDERQKRIAEVMARIAIDGLHPGSISSLPELIRVALSPLAAELWRMEGDNPKIRLDLDPQRKTLVRSEVFNSRDQLTVRTEASDFKEVLAGFWVPQSICCTYAKDDGFVTRQIRLDQIEVDRQLPDTLFRFAPPPRVAIAGDLAP